MWFWNWRKEENLVVNNKDDRVFMSCNYQSDSCPLEILKLAYLPFKIPFSEKYLF